MYAEIWTYRDTVLPDARKLEGFDVEAKDGKIGKVDEATDEIGGSAIVVDTGPWIFGRKVMLPAGVIDRVGVDDRRVFLTLTKDEIENAPEFDASTYHDEAYRTGLADYYGRRRTGFRDMER